MKNLTDVVDKLSVWNVRSLFKGRLQRNFNLLIKTVLVFNSIYYSYVFRLKRHYQYTLMKISLHDSSLMMALKPKHVTLFLC